MEQKQHSPELQRGLPCDLPCERMVLGSVLVQGNECYQACAASLSPEDFMLEAHRRIWHTFAEMDQGGKRIDHVTTGTELHRLGHLEAVGGMTYLTTLDDGMPIIANLDAYIRTVRDKSILRKVATLAESIREQAILGAEDAPELLGRAERMVSDLGMQTARSSEFLTPLEVIRRGGGLDNYLNRERTQGVPTGFPMLDDLICGLGEGQLIILSAVTSGGKSTLARQIAMQAAMRQYPGAFITLEMTNQEVTDGLIAMGAQVDSQIIRRGLSFDREKIRRGVRLVQDIPLYLRDVSTATIPKLQGELRRLKAEKGIRFAFVDYLQLMSGTGRFGNRAEEIGHLSRGLKLIAQDLKICVVALSQIKRLPEGRKRPELFDLRESGSIENDANVVMFLYSERQGMPMDEYPTELIIAKQRGGPIGTIHMGFRKATGTFIEHRKDAGQ